MEYLSKMKVRKPCIYRVPSRIRDVKPEAYTPQMVVIGPLHRSPKSTAKDGAETSSNPWHLEKKYIEMEDIKKTHLESFTKRVGEDTIKEMRKTIQAEEKNIRASYDQEPAEWIPSEYYVELILMDSVFIMDYVLSVTNRQSLYCPMVKDDDSEDVSTVGHDLILLENQLPYFILDRLFKSSMMELDLRRAFDHLIWSLFGLKIEEKTNFKHFTDMLRCVYEKSLDDIPKQMKRYHWRWPAITELRNAENLSQAGVDFKSSDLLDFPKCRRYVRLRRRHPIRRFIRTTIFGGNERPIKRSVEVRSLHVKFEKGTLTMPGFHANEVSDMYLRNVIAFEQCHRAVNPFTSNYIRFLNFLITSNRDVQLLIEEGVVTNALGRPDLVVDMVNKLQVGVKVGNSSQYHHVAKKLKEHCKSRRKMYWATLRKVYFSNLWTGTATLAAVLLLLLTLIGTVASVIQAYESFK